MSLKVSGLAIALAAVNAWAQGLEVIHNFSGTDGSTPTSVVEGADGLLYGTTGSGGSSNDGTIFRLNRDGSGFGVLHEFSGLDGRGPNGLVASGATLYGTTYQGGTSDQGTIFRMSTDGTGFTLLKPDAGSPHSLVLSGSTLFGTAGGGSTSENGVVFRLNVDGTAYKVLRGFSGADGSLPNSLVLSGTNLYGTTEAGGSSRTGSVFRVSTDGTGFAVLKSFESSEGSYPCSLVLCGATLYGAAVHGGVDDDGTIFKLSTDGTGFQVIYQFTNGPESGAGPQSLIASGETLFGTTIATGGAMFQLNTDGTGFGVLQLFRNITNGVWPLGPLLVSGQVIFGMTQYGGPNPSCGLIFALSSPPPALLTVPGSQTAEQGTLVRFPVRAAGARPMSYFWLCNGTNIGNDISLALLQLDSVGPGQAGAYTVIITNLFGSVTSPPAMLSIIQPVERRMVPGLTLAGQPGDRLILERAAVPGPTANWETFDVVALETSPQWHFDTTTPLSPQGFYRARQTNAPAVRLTLNMVPAITLRGTPGTTVQVDSIDQFGPTDAWVSLASVPLTNPSQLYFDTSSVGQPARLYRLVAVP